MKVINYFLALIIVGISLFTACNDDERDTFTAQDGYFVRFHMQLDKNGIPTTNPVSNLTEVDKYTHASTSTIKIPVALSAVIENETTVDFTYEGLTSEAQTLLSNGTLSVNPTQQLRFTSSHLVDTIYVHVNGSLVIEDVSTAIKFTLTKCSDTKVQLGYPNAVKKLDTFTVALNDSPLTVLNFSQDVFAISGNGGESINFSINFSQALFASDIAQLQLFDETDTGYNYTLTQHPYQDGDTQINYTLTYNDNYNPGEEFDLAKLVLKENPGFIVGSLSEVIFRKNIAFPITDIDPASHFYDITNNFYFNRGYYWRDKNNDPAITENEWRAFFMFTRPVTTTDPNYANANGYHKFLLSFININVPTQVTNLFGYQTILSNESTASQLYLESAIYMYPNNLGNGNYDADNGIIRIPERTIILVKTGNLTEHTVTVKGSGEYYKRADGYYGIHFTVFFDETSLGRSNSVQREYYLNSTNSNNAIPRPDIDPLIPNYVTPSINGAETIFIP